VTDTVRAVPVQAPRTDRKWPVRGLPVDCVRFPRHASGRRNLTTEEMEPLFDIEGKELLPCPETPPFVNA